MKSLLQRLPVLLLIASLPMVTGSTLPPNQTDHGKSALSASGGQVPEAGQCTPESVAPATPGPYSDGQQVDFKVQYAASTADCTSLNVKFDQSFYTSPDLSLPGAIPVDPGKTSTTFTLAIRANPTTSSGTVVVQGTNSGGATVSVYTSISAPSGYN